MILLGVLSTGSLAVIGLGGWRWLESAGRPWATLAAVCAAAVLGELCLYHYHYDNVMLVPALFGLLRVVATRPTPGAAVLTVLMMGTLFLPHRLIVAIPASGLLRAAIWAAAAAVLMADGISRRRSHMRDDAASAVAGPSRA